MKFDFNFKEFGIYHNNSTMRVSSDSIILGATIVGGRYSQILDIGTGCGIIALMIAQKTKSQIIAIDIHKDSIIEAKRNFLLSKWSKNFTALHIELSEFTKNCKLRFDLIVSNPPYFFEDIKAKNKKRDLARCNDNLTFDELCRNVKNLLTENGSFWLILPESVFRKFCFEATSQILFCIKKIFIKNKQDSESCLIVSQWKNISQPTQTETIIIKKDDDSYTDEYLKIVEPFIKLDKKKTTFEAVL